MLLSKILSKIENYWLNNFEFRDVIIKYNYKNFYSKFNDIQIDVNEYSELHISTFEHIRYWPSVIWEQYPNRKTFYDFGWKLGLEGNLRRLIETRDWSNTPKTINSVWISKEREKLKDLDSKLYLGFFFKGLSGVLTDKSYYLKEATLVNRVGYDFYWQKNTK